MVVRCEVLGDAHVDWANATKDFTKTFRAFTRVAWGGIPKPQAGTKEGMDGADHATRDDWKITS